MLILVQKTVYKRDLFKLVFIFTKNLLKPKMARKTKNTSNKKASTSKKDVSSKKNIKVVPKRAYRKKKDEDPSNTKASLESDYEVSTEEQSDSDELSESETKKAKQNNAKPVKGKTKTSSEKVECIAIKYDIPSENHPYFLLNNKIDRVQLTEIIGFEENIHREDVGSIKNF